MSIFRALRYFVAEYSDAMEQARTGRRTDTARRKLRDAAMPPPESGKPGLSNSLTARMR